MTETVQVRKSHLGETVIELPIDMHHRLMKVSGNWHYVDKLYPRIQSFSGKEKVA